MNRVSVNPDICNGLPVVSGTRIAVKTILGFLAAGDSWDDILKEYPNLSAEDIRACLQYAARRTESHFLLREVA